MVDSLLVNHYGNVFIPNHQFPNSPDNNIQTINHAKYDTNRFLCNNNFTVLFMEFGNGLLNFATKDESTKRMIVTNRYSIVFITVHRHESNFTRYYSKSKEMFQIVLVKCLANLNGRNKARTPPNHTCLLVNSYHIIVVTMKDWTYGYLVTTVDPSIGNFYHECNIALLRIYQRNKTDLVHIGNQTNNDTKNVVLVLLCFEIHFIDEKVVINYSYLVNTNQKVNST